MGKMKRMLKFPRMKLRIKLLRKLMKRGQVRTSRNLLRRVHAKKEWGLRCRRIKTKVGIHRGSDISGHDLRKRGIHGRMRQILNLLRALRMILKMILMLRLIKLMK
jgi:hypothetical protein